MIFLQMFLTYFQIGLFSFGGGYAAMPLIQSLVVDGKGWLTMAEYTDLLTIAEMTPGPIAVNSATFVGQKMAGLPGAIVCTMIAGAGLTIILMAFFGTSTLSEIPGSPIRFIEMLLFAGSLILLRLKKAGPIQIIFGTAVVGTILYTIVGGI